MKTDMFFIFIFSVVTCAHSLYKGEVNLDLDPRDRWVDICKQHEDKFRSLVLFAERFDQSVSHRSFRLREKHGRGHRPPHHSILCHNNSLVYICNALPRYKYCRVTWGYTRIAYPVFKIKLKFIKRICTIFHVAPRFVIYLLPTSNIVYKLLPDIVPCTIPVVWLRKRVMFPYLTQHSNSRKFWTTSLLCQKSSAMPTAPTGNFHMAG